MRRFAPVYQVHLVVCRDVCFLGASCLDFFLLLWPCFSLLVKLYEVIESDRHVYLVMEFAANGKHSHYPIIHVSRAFSIACLQVRV